MIFIDTCIVIDYINGKLQINSFDTNLYCINSIVDMEVLVGAKNKQDLNTINKRLVGFNIVDIDQVVLNLARNLLYKHVLSHNMTIYDAIIAATCMIYDMPLWTHNKKDFKFLDIKFND